jgi:hypothetical protein
MHRANCGHCPQNTADNLKPAAMIDANDIDSGRPQPNKILNEDHKQTSVNAHFPNSRLNFCSVNTALYPTLLSHFSTTPLIREPLYCTG